MKRELFVTEDGSHSLRIPEWDEQYHSKHGAIQEARHVYIEQGLMYYKQNNPGQTEISILEIGFGTGLNALLTALQTKALQLQVAYLGLEAYPLKEVEWKAMNYATQLDSPEAAAVYNKLHRCNWEHTTAVSSQFELLKRQQRFEDFQALNTVDLIYFDAFGARVQPELWDKFIFERMYAALRKCGVLVTYSAKGSVRRHLKSVGFRVERIPGPLGKREMLRAVKLS